LIVACVNSTKTVSYSDIVSSLVQLNDDANLGLSNLNTIVESFESSNNLLTNLKTSITENCGKLKTRGEEHQQAIKDKVAAYKKTVLKFAEDNKKIQDDILLDEVSVKAEVLKIKKAKDDIKDAKIESVNQEKALLESINVLKRLKNIATDELQGIQQKTTEMHLYNVNATLSSASFIQTASFHQELKNLLTSSDSVNRGLISTLILLAQSAGKQTYANPETVKKIISMIEKIIENSKNKVQQNSNNANEKVKEYSAIAENSRTLIARLKEEIQGRISTKATNEKDIVFYNNDIIFLERALSRRERRNTFTNGLCKEQNDLVGRHYNRYVESLKQVNDLKTELSQ